VCGRQCRCTIGSAIEAGRRIPSSSFLIPPGHNDKQIAILTEPTDGVHDSVALASHLLAEDLHAAWDYYREHPAEIDEDIRENEED
jgi:hypothetical protein